MYTKEELRVALGKSSRVTQLQSKPGIFSKKLGGITFVRDGAVWMSVENYALKHGISL